MDVKLIVVSAKTGTKEILVRRPRILGRARGIGIVIPHPAVSERHCLLFEHGGLLMVQDLNSENGTYLAGRKIIMAPLPPGAEFTVGPLTLRAEYSYAGSLDALPKAIYDEPEMDGETKNRESETPGEPKSESPSPVAAGSRQEPCPPETSAEKLPESSVGGPPEMPLPFFTFPPAEPAVTPQPTTASPSGPQDVPTFFGFGGEVSFPAVAPAAPQPQASVSSSNSPTPAPIAAKPLSESPATSGKRPQPPMPPPLPRVPETPVAEVAQKPDFGGFIGNGSVGGEKALDGIAGLNFDVDPADLPPPQPSPPVKKSGGSLIDFFSKRPPRRKRVARLAPDTIGPFADSAPNPTVPTQPIPAEPLATNPAVAKKAPPVEMPNFSAIAQPAPPSPAENVPPPAEVDDDLSNFFKRLE